jgi:hypothetical protein
MESETDLDKGLKTHCIYEAILDTRQIYTDQTGRLPVISWYYMNMMEMQ